MLAVFKVDTITKGVVVASWNKMVEWRTYAVPAIGHGIDFDNGTHGIVARVRDVVHTGNGQQVTIWLKSISHNEESVAVLKSVGFESLDLPVG